MYTGIVDTASTNGFRLVPLVFDVVNSSGAVSPITLATPKITAVKIPVLAVGKTIFMITRALLEPRAIAASLNSFGTSFKTSSEVLATVGNIKIEYARPPVKAENPETSVKINAAKINSPATIHGTPLIA